MRRVLAPLGIAMALLGYALTGGCSSETTLTGGGGCEAFCTKWIGARCRRSEDKTTCLTRCHEEQTRCLPEANLFLKCATIEAQIACETGSGQPRVVGCLARETALQNCMMCDRFCESWSPLGCPLSPTREECLATCLDQRCHLEHRRIVECMTGGLGTCGPDGRPNVGPMCSREYEAAGMCTAEYGQPQPFRYLYAGPADAGSGG